MEEVSQSDFLLIRTSLNDGETNLKLRGYLLSLLGKLIWTCGGQPCAFAQELKGDAEKVLSGLSLSSLRAFGVVVF